MFVPLNLGYKILNIFVEKKDINQIILYNKTQVLIKEKDNITKKEIKDFFSVSNPFYVIYDKMGSKIDLYYYNNLVTSFNSFHNFPRVLGSFLLLLSSDMMNVKVFSIKSMKEIFNVSTKDFITSFASSENGKYLLIGDMNSDIYVYRENESPFKFSIKASKINYIRGLYIDNYGNFVGVGGIYPDIVFKGNVNNVKKIDFFSIASLPRRGISLKLLGDDFLVEGEDYFYLYIRGEIFSFKKKGSFIDFLPGKNKGEYILVENKNREYFIRLLSLSKTVYTIQIASDFLPFIYNKDGKPYVYFYDFGVVTW